MFLKLATMYTSSVSTVDKSAGFLKTLVSLQFSDLQFYILS